VRRYSGWNDEAAAACGTFAWLTAPDEAPVAVSAARALEGTS